MFDVKFFCCKINVLIVIVLCCAAFNAYAQDGKTLAANANKAINDSKRLMFSGKLEEANAKLNEASALINQLKEVDPSFPGLKTVENAFNRQQKDLSGRLNKDASAIAFELSQIDAGLKSTQDLLAQVKSGSSAWTLENVSGGIRDLNQRMNNLSSKYGDKVSADNPEVKRRMDNIAAFEKEFEAYQAGVQADQAKTAGDKDRLIAQASAIGKKVTAYYQQFGERFDQIHGNSLIYTSKADEAEAELKKIQSLEQEALPLIQPLLAEVVEQYGSNSMEVDNKLHSLGVPGDERFGNQFYRLLKGMENLSKSRRASAAYIASEYGHRIDGINFFTPEIRVQRAEEYKAMLVIGQQFDPNNAEINRLMADIDDKIAEIADKIEQDIDRKTWQKNITDFAGPGDVNKLAQTALEYFRTHDNWGKKTDRGVEVLAVSVQGQWQIAETNIFGQVLSWRLPIHIAITDNTLKPQKIARVYQLSVITRKGAPNKVEKAPPFDNYWVGNNWMMRLNKVK